MLGFVRHSIDDIQLASLDVLDLLEHGQNARNILMSMKYAMNMHNTYASRLDAKRPMNRPQFEESMENYSDGILPNAQPMKEAVAKFRAIRKSLLRAVSP